jgi:hypothetical protein
MLSPPAFRIALPWAVCVARQCLDSRNRNAASGADQPMGNWLVCSSLSIQQNYLYGLRKQVTPRTICRETRQSDRVALAINTENGTPALFSAALQADSRIPSEARAFCSHLRASSKWLGHWEFARPRGACRTSRGLNRIRSPADINLSLRPAELCCNPHKPAQIRQTAFRARTLGGGATPCLCVTSLRLAQRIAIHPGIWPSTR